MIVSNSVTQLDPRHVCTRRTLRMITATLFMLKTCVNIFRLLTLSTFSCTLIL